MKVLIKKNPDDRGEEIEAKAIKPRKVGVNQWRTVVVPYSGDEVIVGPICKSATGAMSYIRANETEAGGFVFHVDK